MKKFRILSATISILVTTASILISLTSRLEYQQLHLWKSVDIVIFNWFVNISLFFIIHLMVGSIILFISFYQCIEIVKINNQAHEAKNQPKELLDSGYYAKVRHPMTTRFMFIVLGFFFMFSSVISIPLIFFLGIIFTLLSFYEEKKILLPVFGGKYREYIKRVKNRFFTIKMKVLFIVLIIFMAIGAIFI